MAKPAFSNERPPGRSGQAKEPRRSGEEAHGDGGSGQGQDHTAPSQRRSETTMSDGGQQRETGEADWRRRDAAGRERNQVSARRDEAQVR